MAYPSSLDNLSESYLGTDQVSVVDHAGMHNSANAAINDIQAKLGIDSSAVTTSIDYLLKSTSSSDPGHKHTVASLTGIPDGSGTTNEISYWVDSNTLGSLTTATYPSLTELSYVKGVTSAIQTQLNAKFTLPSLTAGSILFSDGSTITQDNANLFWDNTNNKCAIGAGTQKLSRFTVQQAADGTITGTTSTHNSSPVIGSGTLFLSEVGIGDRISTSFASSTYYLVTAIASDTSMTVTPTLQGDFNPQTINIKHSLSRWDDSSGATRMLLSDEGYLGIGSTIFRPDYPLTIINSNGLAVSASNTGRRYTIGIDDSSGTTIFGRSDVNGNLTILFATDSATFSSTTATQLSFQINSGELNFVSANGGGAGKITFGRRVSDNNVAVGAAVEFWPTNTQTTPAAAVMAPGGGSYRAKWMPDGSFEAPSTSTHALVVKGIASQSANIYETQLSTGDVRGAINASGDFTNSQYTGSERFGAGASLPGAANTYSTAIGAAAVAGEAVGGSSTAVGASATANANSATAIGARTEADSDNALAIGAGAMAAQNSTAIGTSATASGVAAIAIGKSVSVTNNGAIAMGSSASASNGNAISIGASAICSGGNSLAIGASAEATALGTTVVGVSAEANQEGDIAIGNGAKATASQGTNIVIGYHSTITGTALRATVVGGDSIGTTGSYAVVLGYGSVATYSNVILLGAGTVATATNQFVAGASTIPMNDVFFGKGAVHATPTAYTINGTGGSGSNVVGADIQIAGGKGTGNAAGGSILFQTSDAGSTGTTLQTLTTKLTLTTDGRLYGSALHNNAGSVTGTTNQYIASGTYTPTLTNVTNVSASTAYVCQWIRVGNVVTVSGQVDIDITTTLLASELGMSLPIASDLASNTQCSGVATDDTEQTSTIRVRGDATNNRAQFSWTGQVGTDNLAYSFTFTYLII